MLSRGSLRPRRQSRDRRRVMSGIEMSHWLVLVERLHGPDLASKTTNEIAYDYPLEIGLKPEPSDIPKARDSL